MIVVTGAAGLIGSTVVWKLNQRGDEDILAVDHLGDSDKWKNLRALRVADYAEKGPFLQAVRAGSLPDTIRGIIHLGACSDTRQRDASYLVDNNVEYSKELARFAQARGLRFVYASSAATYGDGSLGFDDRTDIACLRPMNMYGYSKQMFDLWMQRNGGLTRAAGLKYSNVYGPNEHHKGHMRSVVLRAFEQIQAEGRVRLFRSYRPEYADGEQVRDFLYSKDAAAMTLFVYDHPHVNGLFNVGYGDTRTWNDLAVAVFAAMGREPCIEYVEMPEDMRDRYQYHTCLQMAKLRQAGWDAPPTPLENACRDYVPHYLLPQHHLGD